MNAEDYYYDQCMSLAALDVQRIIIMISACHLRPWICSKIIIMISACHAALDMQDYYYDQALDMQEYYYDQCMSRVCQCVVIFSCVCVYVCVPWLGPTAGHPPPACKTRYTVCRVCEV